jgi:hypothetical protein
MDQESAFEIMGEGNAFGIKNAIKFGFRVPPKSERQFSNVPFSKEELTCARNQGLKLIAMPLTTLAQLSSQAPGYFHDDISCLGQLVQVKSRWGYFLAQLKTTEPPYTSSYEHQVNSQAPGFEIMSAVELTYLIVTLALHDQNIYYWLRSSDLNRHQEQVCVKVRLNQIWIKGFGQTYNNTGGFDIASALYRPLTP